MSWVDRVQPDVICLQETKVSDRQFPRQQFEGRDYALLLGGNTGGHGGVAIASRLPMDDPAVGIPGARSPLAELRTLSVTLQLNRSTDPVPVTTVPRTTVPPNIVSPTPVAHNTAPHNTASHNTMRLHTVYGPNGRKVGTRIHNVKLAWLQLFGQWIAMDGLDDGVPTLVVGDLNVAPTDLDVWEPSRYRRRNLTSPEEREAFAKLLDLGLVDLVRSRFGQESVFTWWNRRSDFYETDRGWRLDHALADPATAERVVDISVDREARGEPGASDHAPLIVELDV